MPVYELRKGGATYELRSKSDLSNDAIKSYAMRVQPNFVMPKTDIQPLNELEATTSIGEQPLDMIDKASIKTVETVREKAHEPMIPLKQVVDQAPLGGPDNPVRQFAEGAAETLEPWTSPVAVGELAGIGKGLKLLGKAGPVGEAGKRAVEAMFAIEAGKHTYKTLGDTGDGIIKTVGKAAPDALLTVGMGSAALKPKPMTVETFNPKPEPVPPIIKQPNASPEQVASLSQAPAPIQPVVEPPKPTVKQQFVTAIADALDKSGIDLEKLVREPEKAVEAAKPVEAPVAKTEPVVVPEAVIPKPVVEKAPRTFKQKYSPDKFGDDPLISHIIEQGGLVSKSGAKKSGKFDKVGSASWDDTPKLSHPSHNKIYKATSSRMPDQVAQSAFEAGLIKEPTTTALWQAVDRASQGARKEVARNKAEAEYIKAHEKQVKEFDKTQTKPSAEAQPIAAKDLNIGEVVEVGKEKFKVTEIDPDTHDVTLEDGKKYGIQVVNDGDIVYAERVEVAPKVEQVDPFAGKPELTLESPTDAQLLAEKESAATKSKIQELQDKRLTASEIDTTGDLLDPTKADNPLFAQQQPKPAMVGMGAAVPDELARSRESPTAMKYKLIDQERQKRGLEPLVTGRKSLTDQATMDKAIAKLDTEPGYGDRLVEEINSGKRTTIDDWENHVLLLKKIDLQVERARVARDTIQAYEDGKKFPGRADEAKALSLEGQSISDQLTALEQASRTSGSYRGAALRSLRVLAYEDYSLAKMEMETRAAKGGRQLTKEELGKLQEMQAKIESTQKAYDDYVASSSQRISELEADKALNAIKLESIKQPTVEPHIKIIADKVKVYFDQRAEAALKRLSGKTFTLGPDVLADLADLGASKILSGAIEFGQWSVKMVEVLGEKVKPHLKTIFDASNKALDDTAARFAGAKESAKVKRAVRKADATEQKASILDKLKEKAEGGKLDEIAGLVQKLARSLVEQGIRQRDPLIDAVHDVLKDFMPDITKREVMDAISGYGKFKQLSKDEISVQLRDLKGQMQQVAKLEDMQAGQPPSKTGLERRIPSTEESRLIREVNKAKQEFQIPVDDPNTQLKSSLDTLKARLKNRTAELQDKLARGDFSKKPKREIVRDAEANRLHFEMSKAKAKYQEALMRDRLANRTTPQKVMAGLGETLNTFRALMTGGEFSAVLRQGGIPMLMRPITTSKSLPAMFEAFKSEKLQHAIEQEIMGRDSYQRMRQSGLELTERGQELYKMEEATMNRWGDKIPFIAGTQRAYTTFLNKVRADFFDVFHRTLARSGEVTMAESKAISNFINVITGRGSLGKKAQALVGLNTVFFAPRYVASRFQFIAGQPLYGGTLRTRKLIAAEYGRFFMGLSAVYALGKMAGAEVETNRTSSDFGKLRFGNTRLDPLMGLSQSTVFLSRLKAGETKKLTGKIVQNRGDKVPFGQGLDSVIGRFLRTKLSPAFGATLDIVTGKDLNHQKVTPQSVATKLVKPITYGDIYEAMKEQGIPAGTAMSILAFFGYGLETHEDKKGQRTMSDEPQEPNRGTLAELYRRNPQEAMRMVEQEEAA